MENFVRAWDLPTPLILIPTAYPQLTNARIEAMGKVKAVIFGNHGIRASVRAMQEVFAQIRKDGGIQNVDADIAPVEEIFRLQEMARVHALEEKYT